MCDTLIALGNSTKNKQTIFAKNSDRDPDEPADIVYIPRTKHPKGSQIKTTYISIPQIRETFGILLCKPIWIWGAEMGVNEFGVVIGNEAIYTKEPIRKEEALLGMDLLRLALERGRTAKDAREIIIELLETYGQGGNCGYRGKTYYHNSFLIADKEEAWVLETADKYWISEQVHDIRTISNTISIGGKGDIRHPELIEHALEKGWCNDADEFDFSKDYLPKFNIYQYGAKGNKRMNQTREFLKKHQGEIQEQTMMNILRRHYPDKEHWSPAKDGSMASVCMHAKGLFTPTQTTNSMVSVLDDELLTNWVSGTSAPCTSIFKPIFLPGGMPKIGPEITAFYDDQTLWWRHEKLHRLVLMDYQKRLSIFKEEREKLEQKIMRVTGEYIDQIKKQLKKEKSLEQRKTISEKLQNYSKEIFKETMAKENEWIKEVQGTALTTKPCIFYRLFWKRRNKWNKMPKMF